MVYTHTTFPVINDKSLAVFVMVLSGLPGGKGISLDFNDMKRPPACELFKVGNLTFRVA
jgi:hypothetical protein